MFNPKEMRETFYCRHYCNRHISSSVSSRIATYLYRNDLILVQIRGIGIERRRSLVCTAIGKRVMTQPRSDHHVHGVLWPSVDSLHIIWGAHVTLKRPGVNATFVIFETPARPVRTLFLRLLPAQRVYEDDAIAAIATRPTMNHVNRDRRIVDTCFGSIYAREAKL